MYEHIEQENTHTVKAMNTQFFGGFSMSVKAWLFGFFVALLTLSPGVAAADYEDWWLCANNCAPDDAACIDKCTEEYNNTHATPYPADLCIRVLTDTGFLTPKTGLDRVPHLKGLKLKRGVSSESQCDSKPDLITPCPVGSVATPFEMPVYDAAGLFVTCYKTISVCVPQGLEPAK